jgi:RHS repeat-associated protein
MLGRTVITRGYSTQCASISTLQNLEKLTKNGQTPFGRAAGVPRTQLTMVYDGQGRRVQKSVTKSEVAGLVNVRRDYFTNDSLSGPVASTVFGGNVDDSWFRGQGLPYPGLFSYRASAELRVPATGQWTLEIATFEGGARLYVNNVLVVDTWNAGATTPVTLALAAGTAHTLRYEYRFIPGVIGGATPISRLSWSGPGQSLQSVPNAADTTGPAVTTTTRYLYDGWNLLAEISSTGSAVRTYAWGLDLSGSAQGAGGVGGLISVTDSVGGTAHFAAYDGNGNVSGLVRADDGSLSARYDYNAFGETILAEGAFASGNPFRFSTKFTDDETGLLYYGFRYYNPATGRWLSRDPIEEKGGLNLYAFCRNGPPNYYDPYGLDTFGDISNFVAGAGDALSFGLTRQGRKAISWMFFDGYNDSSVDTNSKSYVAGEWTEIVVETTVTLGGASLRHVAKRTVRYAVEGSARGSFRRANSSILNKSYHVVR